MQRAGVKEHFRAGKQRREQPDGQAEGVKQRQRGHKTVFRGKVGNGPDLLDIRQQALMAVHHTFRIAFGTRRKQHHRGIFRLLFDLGQTRHQYAGENPQLVGAGNVAFKIFKKDPAHLGELLRQMPEFAFIEKLAGGKYGFNLGRGNGAAQSFNARGIVHHRRNTPTHRGTDNHRRADSGVGQHQANGFTRCAVFFQNTRHEQGFGQ